MLSAEILGGDNKFALREKISDCCALVEVVQTQAAKTGAKDKHPYIFTTYHIEDNFLNGRVHYTSKDGTNAIAYNNERGDWNIQPAGDRYDFTGQP